LLLNASATGAETLKNLVLPGVQKFTIVDDQTISLADVTNNFFVSQEFLHEPRGKIVTELLMEMNTDVTGYFRLENPSQLLQNGM
jgi:amyloid beta precursor protein binding protein 1